MAQTVNTTMGMALIYGGIRLKSTQRILTSDHDFSGGRQMLEACQRRQGTPIDSARLFDRSNVIRPADVVKRLVAKIQRETRLVALTWVHSNTGVKLPVRDIADELRRLNATRAPEDQLLLSIDGVHGFGVEDATFADLGVTSSPPGAISGCSARGGPRSCTPPAKPGRPSSRWPPRRWTTRWACATPTGVNNDEHHWAVAEAFRFLIDIGKAEIQDRVHSLATRLKQGLKGLKHVEVVTPMPRAHSSGIVCFDIKGMTSAKVVERMRARGITASESATDPLAGPGKHVRLTPSILNSDKEIGEVLKVVRSLRP